MTNSAKLAVKPRQAHLCSAQPWLASTTQKRFPSVLCSARLSTTRSRWTQGRSWTATSERWSATRVPSPVGGTRMVNSSSASGKGTGSYPRAFDQNDTARPTSPAPNTTVPSRSIRPSLAWSGRRRREVNPDPVDGTGVRVEQVAGATRPPPRSNAGRVALGCVVNGRGKSLCAEPHPRRRASTC